MSGFDGTTAETLRLIVTRNFPDNMGVYYTLIRPNGTVLRDHAFMFSDQITLAKLPLAEGVRLERRLFHMLAATEDKAEGMAAFIEKRTPVWKGR